MEPADNRSSFKLEGDKMVLSACFKMKSFVDGNK